VGHGNAFSLTAIDVGHAGLVHPQLAALIIVGRQFGKLQAPSLT